MALNTENDMVMPVAPMYNSGNGGGFGDFGGNSGWWIILLFILLGNNGWNNGGGNWNGGGFVPYMADAGIQRGFDQSAIMSGINGISGDLCNGFAGVQQSMCNGFAEVNQGMANGFAGAEIAANSRQIANMNQMFGVQNAMSQGFNQIASQFADCCCENRLANCQTQNIIQNEGNATRFADANNTRDMMTALNSGIQSIKDQLCEYRNDQKDETIANLRQELMYSRGQASQVEQTAQLLANNNAQTAIFQQGMNAEVDALYNRLNNCPVPTTPVYGRTPIFNCNNNGYNCGCGQ